MAIKDMWDVERSELDFTMTLLKGEVMNLQRRDLQFVTRSIHAANTLDGALRM